MKVYFSDPKRQSAALKSLLGSRTSLPSVRHFLFEAEPEGLYVTATDLEVGLRIFHPAQVSKPGRAIVPESVVDLLEGEEVMTLSLSDKGLSVRCGGFSRQCPILDPADFPTIPTLPVESGVQLTPAALDQLLGAGRFISGEDTRAIDAVQLKWTGTEGGGKVTATATDGFKLCRSTVKGESSTAGAALVTRRGVAALDILTARVGDDPVTLSVSGEKLFAVRGKDRLWASLRTGNYPDVSEILKSSQSAKVSGTVEFKVFHKSVERSLKALLDEKDRKGANALLTAGAGQIKIAFSAQEAGTGEAVLPFQNDGAEPVSVPYNLPVLADVLSGLRSISKSLEICQISLNGPGSPMVIGAAAEHGPVLVLIMPVAA